MGRRDNKLPDTHLPVDVQIKMLVAWLEDDNNQPYEGENSDGALVWCGDIGIYTNMVDRLCQLIKER